MAIIIVYKLVIFRDPWTMLDSRLSEASPNNTRSVAVQQEAS